MPSPTPTAFTRRHALKTGATAGAALTLSGPLLNHAAIARGTRVPIATAGSFEHGVASGFPRPKGAVLWTRLTGLDRTSRVNFEVARDADFRRIVRSDRAHAFAKRDFTIHAEVGGLKPATEYHYRFFTKEGESTVGRFRTAPPPDSMQPVRVGFYSCQSYEAGFFNAHAALAEEPDLDLVVCLGDYIYEQNFYDGPEERRDTTGSNGDGDVQTLGEYRDKYRLYQADPDLQAMQAAHPLVSIWDDHEVEENNAGQRPSSKADEGEDGGGTPRRIPYLERRRNAYHTFFEAMPRKRIKRDPDRIYGRARLGRMADLFLLDTRQYRDQQPCGDQIAVPCPDTDDPSRVLLGAEQKGWLKQSLERSPATWKLLGNQIMLMGFDSAPGVTLNVDGWDGYAAERRELMEHVLEKDVANVVSLVGDVHTFFAGQVTPSGRLGPPPAAVEFVGGSMTSFGVNDTFNLTPQQFALIADRGLLTNPHWTYANFVEKGYGVVSMNAEEIVCEYKAVATTAERNRESFSLAKFRVAAGSHEVEQL